MNARKRTPCFALSIASNTSFRSPGVGGGGAPFFLLRGTFFCGVEGENHTRTFPAGWSFSSFRSCVFLTLRFPERKPADWSLLPSPFAASVSDVRSSQYCRYSAASAGDSMIMALLLWAQRPVDVQFVLPERTARATPLSST